MEEIMKGASNADETTSDKLEKNTDDDLIKQLNLYNLIEMNLTSDVEHVDYDQHDLRVFNTSDNDLNYVTCDYIDPLSDDLNLSSDDRDLIDCLSVAFYETRKRYAIDLDLQKQLACLMQVSSESLLKKMSKLILANFIVQPVKRVIAFAKLLSDFRRLDMNDQKHLLQCGTLEVFILSSTSLYDHTSNKFLNLISRDRHMNAVDSSSIQLDLLRYIWSEDIYEKTIGFLKSVSELAIDETTLILLISLVLFSPDRRLLQQRTRITLMQSKYSFLLKKYIIWKYGLNEEAIKLYNRLLLKLVEVRTLNEIHSALLINAETGILDFNKHIQETINNV